VAQKRGAPSVAYEESPVKTSLIPPGQSLSLDVNMRQDLSSA